MPARSLGLGLGRLPGLLPLGPAITGWKLHLQVACPIADADDFRVLAPAPNQDRIPPRFFGRFAIERRVRVGGFNGRLKVGNGREGLYRFDPAVA